MADLRELPEPCPEACTAGMVLYAYAETVHDYAVKLQKRVRELEAEDAVD